MRMYRNNVGGVLLIPAAENLRLAPGEIFDLHAYFPEGQYPWEIQQLLNAQAIVPIKVNAKQMQATPFSSAPQGDSIR